MYELIGFVAVLYLMFLVGMIVFTPTRTKRYRREIVDMYVAGKIRQLAKKDSIDLEEEYKVFRCYHKKQRAEIRDVDNTIEVELQDKIIDEASKDTISK